MICVLLVARMLDIIRIYKFNLGKTRIGDHLEAQASLVELC
jgi:hypothetical protein